MNKVLIGSQSEHFVSMMKEVIRVTLFICNNFREVSTEIKLKIEHSSILNHCLMWQILEVAFKSFCASGIKCTLFIVIFVPTKQNNVIG